MAVVLTATTRVKDWRALDASCVAPLIDAEIQAWRQTLSWDVADAWRVVEPARQAGQLPGLVAFDAEGRPSGWTAYLPHRGHLQVMALEAGTPEVAATLVDGMLTSAEARACDSTLFCVRAAVPSLPSVLAARGFTIDAYRYLTRVCEDRPAPAHSFIRWHGHETAMADLCGRAYRSAGGVRAFAPGGTRDEWRQYIETLVKGTSCGWFMPELSFVLPAAEASADRALQAAIMLTDLGTGTAHIAQVAVDPDARGRGLGRRLVETAMDEAGRFYDQVSLLVSGANTPAVRLYESLGFQDHAGFVVASRPTTG